MEVTARTVFYIGENNEGNRNAAQVAIKATVDSEYLDCRVDRRDGEEFLDNIVGMIRALGVIAVRVSGGLSTYDLLKGRVKVVLGEKCAKIAKAKARKARKQERCGKMKELSDKVAREKLFLEGRINKLESLFLFKDKQEGKGAKRDAALFASDALMMKDLSGYLSDLNGLIKEAEELEAGDYIKVLLTLKEHLTAVTRKFSDTVIPFLEEPVKHAAELGIAFDEAYDKKIGAREFKDIPALQMFLCNQADVILKEQVGEHGLTKKVLEGEIVKLLKRRRVCEYSECLLAFGFGEECVDDRSLSELAQRYTSLDPKGPKNIAAFKMEIKRCYDELYTD